MDDDCKTGYPIMLVHGAGFRDLKRPLYWGRIPGALKAHGATIHYGLQDGWGSTKENALALKRRLEDVLRESGAEKLNLIGHSKGGLEIRALASSLGMAHSIASVTTVATPHRGSRTVDLILKAPISIFNVAAFALNNWVRVLGDQRPDFLSVLEGFSTERMALFNAENPDVPGVYYQSYACAMRHPFSDINLSTANFIIDLIEGPNDGLVSVASAAWGEKRVILHGATGRGISHLDAIDFRRAPFSRRKAEGAVLDITQVYVDIASGLRARGF